MNEEEILNYETLHNKIYKETEEYGRTQFVSRIVDLQQKIELLNQCIKTDKDKIDYWVNKYEELQQKIEKAIEFTTLKFNEDNHLSAGSIARLLSILIGSDIK